ncbi:hypothetical protein BKA70DRAFT_1314078 [Coprinopsis sp. MPI-PUGE-AT-0042]|nr:hypothetical protein BKA70DRAFT_1314078 [Coprinopsis sp. MPI-PUGE-AT-0042]
MSQPASSDHEQDAIDSLLHTPQTNDLPLEPTTTNDTPNIPKHSKRKRNDTDASTRSTSVNPDPKRPPIPPKSPEADPKSLQHPADDEDHLHEIPFGAGVPPKTDELGNDRPEITLFPLPNHNQKIIHGHTNIRTFDKTAKAARQAITGAKLPRIVAIIGGVQPGEVQYPQKQLLRYTIEETLQTYMPDTEFTKIAPDNILPRDKGTYPSPIVIHNISPAMGKRLVDLQGVFSTTIQAWFYDLNHEHSTSFVGTLENLLISNDPVTLARTAEGMLERLCIKLRQQPQSCCIILLLQP